MLLHLPCPWLVSNCESSESLWVRNFKSKPSLWLNCGYFFIPWWLGTILSYLFHCRAGGYGSYEERSTVQSYWLYELMGHSRSSRANCLMLYMSGVGFTVPLHLKLLRVLLSYSEQQTLIRQGTNVPWALQHTTNSPASGICLTVNFVFLQPFRYSALIKAPLSLTQDLISKALNLSLCFSGTYS